LGSWTGQKCSSSCWFDSWDHVLARNVHHLVGSIVLGQYDVSETVSTVSSLGDLAFFIFIFSKFSILGD